MLLVRISILILILTKNDEQILALERRTGYSSWTGNEGRLFKRSAGSPENGEPTTDNDFFQLTTWNLQLIVILQLATQNLQLGSLATNNLELGTALKKGR